MNTRRTIRAFYSCPVPEDIVCPAGTAPSGALKQPWTFCLITDPKIKEQIRIAAEAEEKESYLKRISEKWKQDLIPFGYELGKTIFGGSSLPDCGIQTIGLENSEKSLYYYVAESVGIACGFLIAAIHQAGLVTVSHTPSPMNFLSKILMRPKNEKPFLVLPEGNPKAGA